MGIAIMTQATTCNHTTDWRKFDLNGYTTDLDEVVNRHPELADFLNSLCSSENVNITVITNGAKTVELRSLWGENRQLSLFSLDAFTT